MGFIAAAPSVRWRWHQEQAPAGPFQAPPRPLWPEAAEKPRAEWGCEKPVKMGLPPSWHWALLGPRSSLLVLTGAISFELGELASPWRWSLIFTCQPGLPPLSNELQGEAEGGGGRRKTNWWEQWEETEGKGKGRKRRGSHGAGEGWEGDLGKMRRGTDQEEAEAEAVKGGRGP